MCTLSYISLQIKAHLRAPGQPHLFSAADLCAMLAETAPAVNARVSAERAAASYCALQFFKRHPVDRVYGGQLVMWTSQDLGTPTLPYVVHA